MAAGLHTHEVERCLKSVALAQHARAAFMAFKVRNFFPLTVRHVWLVAGAAVLAGCGGSQSSGTSAAANTAAAGTTSVAMQFDVPASEASNLGAQPTFHVAPVLLDEPGRYGR